MLITSNLYPDTRLAATIPFIFLFYLFYDIAYTPMLIAYTLEILPFNIRAKGFAVMVSGSISPIDACSLNSPRTSLYLLLSHSINLSIPGLLMLSAGVT